MITVNVDAGHGSNTAGKRTPPMPFEIDIEKDGKIDIKKGEQFKEHIANVGVATILIVELGRCGIKTLITGFDDEDATDDLDVSLSVRQKTIAAANCDLSVSIHFNAFGSGKDFNTASGVGIYIHDKQSGDSLTLATNALEFLAKGSAQKNRSITKASLAMCNCKSMDVKAAILVELAFMTNKQEATELMASKAYWKESAQEIAKGICKYAGIKYVEEKKTVKKYYRVQVGAYEVYSNAEKIQKEFKKLGYKADIV